MNGRARILVLDDEPVIRRVVAELLEDIEMVCAGTLAEARAVLASTSIDAALLDKNLPDGSGLTIARELRDRDPHVAIILLTGYPSTESAVEALGAGVDDYVTKPFNAAELEVKLRNAIDRTRLRRGHERLRESVRQSEELYRELIAASPDGIVFIDVTTQRVLMANAAAAKLYGYSQTELVGLEAATLLAPGEQLAVPKATAAEARQPSLRRDCTKSGGFLKVEVSTGFSRLSGRDVLVWIIRDITERERLEVEQQRSSRMQTIGKLAGGVAHDLNNLLCVLDCTLTALTSVIDDNPVTRMGEVRELLAELRYACDAQARLTRQLGMLGAQGVGSSRVVAVADVLDDLKKVLSRTIEEHVSLVVTAESQLPSLRIDRGELEQVIVNLVVNARDAMPDGGGIVISAKRVEVARHAGVEIRVADTGTGIPESALQHIFEPFFTTKEPGRGTGMGLATVARIIEKAGGRIGVTSVVGKGTTFTIVLPGTEGESAPEAVRRETPFGHGERILVVEDDELLARTVTRVLASAGYAVLRASHATPALELLANERVGFDLVLTDIVMPEVSGIKLAERINAERPHTKVVFMSGYERAGATGQTLTKPFSPQALLAFVGGHLSQSKASARR